ncbi:cytochrome P450 [Sciscionella sediminilitoris]|uniref:cytochrome P450 n=1 Tax=Sciscionella sediminilitoris TaxID=1445613 RepID=UPI0004DFB842|nr:cytochrome P450 [Sciscionella sp. SE31]
MPTDAETATVPETAMVLSALVLPTVLTGVVKRRPGAMQLANRLGTDRRAIELLFALREYHGPGPIRLRLPGRSIVLVLDPGQVSDILADTPEPFDPATTEKVAALGHFQPHGVLISDRSARGSRREFHEAALQPGHELPESAQRFASVIATECQWLEGLVLRTGELGWNDFNEMWWRIVRRIVLGDAARDDRRFNVLLDELRNRANWAYLAAPRRRTRSLLRDRLWQYCTDPEPGSLVERVSEIGQETGTDPVDQIPHWLFAFDAAGMTVMRTLALLAAHPAAASAAAAEAVEMRDTHLSAPPFLNACVQDCLRLWPTTPLLLRETREQTAGRTQTLPEDTTFLIFTPFFHRDRETIPFADQFSPQAWLDGRAERQPGIVPFSAGPAVCPGRDVVRFVMSTTLACLLNRYDYELIDGPIPDRASTVPATIDHFRLRLRPRARETNPEP